MLTLESCNVPIIEQNPFVIVLRCNGGAITRLYVLPRVSRAHRRVLLVCVAWRHVCVRADIETLPIDSEALGIVTRLLSMHHFLVLHGIPDEPMAGRFWRSNAGVMTVNMIAAGMIYSL